MECRTDEECSDTQSCHNFRCVDPCIVSNECGLSADCVSRHHQSTCQCRDGFSGDPFLECASYECQTNEDCPTNKFCLRNQCLDPCVVNDPCGRNAVCTVGHYTVSCKCPPTTVGDPLIECISQPPSFEPVALECEIDSDCSSGLACISNSCQNPCFTIDPCDKSAVCSVVDTTPFRTMVCKCMLQPLYMSFIGGGDRKIQFQFVILGRVGWVPDSSRSCVSLDIDNISGCIKGNLNIERCKKHSLVLLFNF